MKNKIKQRKTKSTVCELDTRVLTLLILTEYLRILSQKLRLTSFEQTNQGQSQLLTKLQLCWIFKPLSSIPRIVDVVEIIVKNNHIFNNITIILRPRVIKVSLKSDIAIIWLNIWDVQSRSKAKGLINRCFNVGSYIATI